MKHTVGWLKAWLDSYPDDYKVVLQSRPYSTGDDVRVSMSAQAIGDVFSVEDAETVVIAPAER